MSVIDARQSDDHASLTFSGGAVLTVERAKKRWGKSGRWVALLRIVGEMDRAVQSRR